MYRYWHRYRPIMQLSYRYRHQYRPIWKSDISVVISIGRYEKMLIGRPLYIVFSKLGNSTCSRHKKVYLLRLKDRWRKFGGSRFSYLETSSLSTYFTWNKFVNVSLMKNLLWKIRHGSFVVLFLCLIFFWN